MSMTGKYSNTIILKVSKHLLFITRWFFLLIILQEYITFSHQESLDRVHKKTSLENIKTTDISCNHETNDSEEFLKTHKENFKYILPNYTKIIYT